MADLAQRCPENGQPKHRASRITLVIDEAYHRFSNPPKTFAALNFINENQPELVVLRSLTKDYGLAGLRLG